MKYLNQGTHWLDELGNTHKFLKAYTADMFSYVRLLPCTLTFDYRYEIYLDDEMKEHREDGASSYFFRSKNGIIFKTEYYAWYGKLIHENITQVSEEIVREDRQSREGTL